MKGGKNLMILGVIAVIIALSTTSVSLAIYHNSGDIYLDRSRPGYLPDKEEIEQNEEDSKDDEYVFDKEGVITSSDIEEYIKNLKTEVEALEVYKNAFSLDALSDDKLGI